MHPTPSRRPRALGALFAEASDVEVLSLGEVTETPNPRAASGEALSILRDAAGELREELRDDIALLRDGFGYEDTSAVSEHLPAVYSRCYTPEAPRTARSGGAAPGWRSMQRARVACRGDEQAIDPTLYPWPLVGRAESGCAYTVDFGKDVTGCIVSATLAGVNNGAGTDTPDPGGTAAVNPGPTDTSLAVTTFDRDGSAANQPFHLLLAC